jgi:V/A-type H+-transporting ATPase subunit A
MQSYSGYVAGLESWWHDKVDKEWTNYREDAMRILQAEDDLKNIVKLVGPEALPDKQRLILETARIIRMAFLQQNALDPIDTYCSPNKQFKMLKIIVDFQKLANRIIERGAPIFKITQLPILQEIMRMKNSVPNDKLELLENLERRIREHFEELEASLK